MKKEKDVIVDMGEVKKNRFSMFVEKLILVWFVLVILFFIFKPKIVEFLVTLFGQFFFLMGLIIFAANEGKQKRISIIFFIFGILGTVIPLLYIHPEIWEALLNK